MYIPDELLRKYPVTDGDTLTTLRIFAEPQGSRILEVGAHDEPIANLLTEMGYRVTGIDLREYNPTDKAGGIHPPCNYKYVRADFCNLSDERMYEWMGLFDSVVSVSALEHFGFGTYREGPFHPYYDVIAARTIWQMLRDGGTAYIVVPFGGKHIDLPPHWRVYDSFSLKDRIIQDFQVEYGEAFIAAECQIAGEKRNFGDHLTKEEACSYSGHPPHVSVILKLRKVPVHRLSPDGR